MFVSDGSWSSDDDIYYWYNECIVDCYVCVLKGNFELHLAAFEYLDCTYTFINLSYSYSHLTIGNRQCGVRSLARAPKKGYCLESNSRPFNQCDWV